MQHQALLPLPVSDDELIPAHRLPLYVGLAAQTLARWRCEGQGPAFLKIGRRVAYRAGDVRAWLRQRVRSNTIEGARATS
jgi:predicted DNA-binding transcriptional regulator AlpA